MRVTILGSGVAWARAGGACAGYLVEQDGRALLLDCGPGVVGPLQAQLGPARLDAVVVSHLHPDHYLDLVTLRHAVKHGGLRASQPTRILLPPRGRDRLVRLGTVLDDDPRFFSDVFELAEHDATHPVRVAGFEVLVQRVQHPVPTFAVRVRGDGVLAYSADSGPCDALAAIARDADLFLCEAAALSAAAGSTDSPRGHLTAREAGQFATRAGARRLLLTHAPIDPYDPERAVREARQSFAGPVEPARDGATYTVVGPGVRGSGA